MTDIDNMVQQMFWADTNEPLTPEETAQYLTTHPPHSKVSIKNEDKVNPSHYQNFFEDEIQVLQWCETMNRIKRYRTNPEVFIGALEFQVRKYLDRNGGKDDELQEYRKGLWYYKYLVAYMINGCKPVKVEDIPELLGE